MDLSSLLVLFKRKCTHEGALEHSHEGYCPHCGAYLKKYYYVVRCAHCGIKRESKITLQDIEPVTNFCQNCGGEEYYIEKLEKIDISDIGYAIQKKEVIYQNNFDETTQIWVEENIPLKRIKYNKA